MDEQHGRTDSRFRCILAMPSSIVPEESSFRRRYAEELLARSDRSIRLAAYRSFHVLAMPTLLPILDQGLKLPESVCDVLAFADFVQSLFDALAGRLGARQL